MAGISGYYHGEKRKLSKQKMTKLAKKLGKSWELPRVEIISRKKSK